VERLSAVSHDFESIQDRARLLQDEIAGRIGNATNHNLCVISLLTAIFLPITSDYGYLWNERRRRAMGRPGQRLRLCRVSDDPNCHPLAPAPLLAAIILIAGQNEGSVSTNGLGLVHRLTSGRHTVEALTWKPKTNRKTARLQ
jgi:hypothetical protein